MDLTRQIFHLMDVLFRIHKDSLSEKLTPRSQSLTSLLSETAAILMLGFTVCGRPGCTVPPLYCV